jgi:hypothetical protein
MKLIPWFDNRDFSSQVGQPGGITWHVLNHRWMAVGGPDRAEIAAAGGEAAVWMLVDVLRRPVKILTGWGEPVWWGYAHQVEITAGDVTYVISLEGMANRVRAWYRPMLPNADYPLPAVATSWADDAASQAVYGVKELQEVLRENTASGAAALRDTLLALTRYPVRSLETGTLPAAPGDLAVSTPQGCFAKVTALGWWHTTGWQHYEQPGGLVQLANPGGTSLTPLGNATNQQLISSFTTPSGTIAWTTRRVYLRVSKYGAPADNLTLDLLDSGLALLGTGSIAAGTIGKAGWYEFALGAPVVMNANTLYYLRISRSGAQDAANYYRVEMDTTYQGSAAQYWNGSAWVSFAPPVSLLFKVTGEEDTAVQIGRMLASGAGGQFLPNQDLPAASGNAVTLWRDGKKTARAEVEALLEMGSGSRRYLATVAQDRRLTVSLAPLPGSGDIGLRRDGGIIDPAGNLLRPGFVAAGVWAAAVDLTPALLVGPQMVDAARVWVEAMEWDNLAERRVIPAAAAVR